MESGTDELSPLKRREPEALSKETGLSYRAQCCGFFSRVGHAIAPNTFVKKVAYTVPTVGCIVVAAIISQSAKSNVAASLLLAFGGSIGTVAVWLAPPGPRAEDGLRCC
jgi:hypothetical protein